MYPVQKPWVFQLPFRMQTVLMSATRGADGVPKEDKSKVLVRGLRELLYNNADPTSSFMKVELTEAQVEAFASDIDHYHVHFLMHLTHAVEIVGYKHPDDLVRARWIAIYKRICKSLHLNFETENQLDVRLGHMEGFLEQQRKTTVVAKAVVARVPKPVPKIAPSDRPIELDLDNRPTGAVRQVDPKVVCDCGHIRGEHYQPKPESEPDLFECSSGKCKCAQFKVKPPPAPVAVQPPVVAAQVIRALGNLVVCVCRHSADLHAVPHFSGPERRCSSSGCGCRAFVDAATARRTGDAGTGTSRNEGRGRGGS